MGNYQHFKDYLDIISLFITICKLYNILNLTKDLVINHFFNIDKIKEIVDVYDIDQEQLFIGSTPADGLNISKKDGKKLPPLLDSKGQYNEYFRNDTADTTRKLLPYQFGSFPTFCHHKLGLSTIEIPFRNLFKRLWFHCKIIVSKLYGIFNVIFVINICIIRTSEIKDR